jgi:D-alanine-D-alanine ligase
MYKVVLLLGGDSPERDVSLRSGATIQAALEELGHVVSVIDPNDDIKNHEQALKSAEVVFSVIHGKGGEDGDLQAYLESLKVPFVGSDSASSRICFDKNAYKKIIASNGLPVAQSSVVTPNELWSHPLTKQPFVLKPIKGGSSLDTFIVRDISKINKNSLEETLIRYGSMLLEQLIVGTEITVGVLESEALPVIEIIPPAHVEFDYENKYNGATQELIPPQHVSEEIQKQAQELALKAHRVTGCRDISRTDMMIDTHGNIYVLETNTMPGMTDQSLYPKQAAAVGYTMPELCQKLINLALLH